MNASDLITHSMLEIPGQEHVVVFVYVTWPCICQVAGAGRGEKMSCLLLASIVGEVPCFSPRFTQWMLFPE